MTLSRRPRRAFVLAAGVGSRLGSLTESTPKCLLEIGGAPLLGRWLAQLEGAGITHTLINTHHLATHVERFVENWRASHSMRIETFFERELLGSAGTLAASRAFIPRGESALVVYADNVSAAPIPTLLTFHEQHSLPLSVALFHAERPRECGIATLDADGTITKFTEKPKKPKSDLANAGLYVMDSVVLDAIADSDVRDIAAHVVPQWLGKARGWICRAYHRDIGTPESLVQARLDIREGALSL